MIFLDAIAFVLQVVQIALVEFLVDRMILLVIVGQGLLFPGGLWVNAFIDNLIKSADDGGSISSIFAVDVEDFVGIFEFLHD